MWLLSFLWRNRFWSSGGVTPTGLTAGRGQVYTPQRVPGLVTSQRGPQLYSPQRLPSLTTIE